MILSCFIISSAQLYPNIKLMIVGVHGIGKTTLLKALRREGQGSFKAADYQPHFNDRRKGEKGDFLFVIFFFFSFSEIFD